MSYTQSPHMTDDEIDALLSEAMIARLCTHNTDGTIHVAPVWYLYENGKILIGTPKRSRKASNIRRDGRVTLIFDEVGPPTRGVIIYGEADTKELDGDKMLTEGVSIFRRYMTEEKAQVYAEGLNKISRWIKITVKPNRFASFDYSKDDLYRRATRGQIE